MSTQEEPCPQGYESFEMDTRRISIFAVGLLAFLVLVFVGVLALLQALEAGGHVETSEDSVHPLGPRETPYSTLRTDSQHELEALRREEAGILNDVAWIDREHGVVRIPIEHAMKLMAMPAGHTDREQEVSDE